MCAKFYKNWLSFVEDITKTILVCFFMGHSVYLPYVLTHFCLSVFSLLDGLLKKLWINCREIFQKLLDKE